MSVAVRRGDTRPVISNVVIHLVNELPIVVDMEALPSGSDRSVVCTNVRTVDGKRPQFVHDRNSTFVFPMGMIRLIEAPLQTGSQASAREDPPRTVLRGASSEPDSGALVPLEEQPDETSLDFDEEPDEDLLARIRSV